MKRITIYLDEDLWWEFRKDSLDRRQSASATLTELLQKFLRHRQKRQKLDHPKNTR
jgi:hypothetical protein